MQKKKKKIGRVDPAELTRGRVDLGAELVPGRVDPLPLLTVSLAEFACGYTSYLPPERR